MRHIGYLNILHKILILALAYFITGRFGLLLAIPPGYATPFWPPSGIALAIVYLYGYRFAPGVFLGSSILNLASTMALAHSYNDIMLINALMIGVGATLQACAGAYALRRAVGPECRLEQLSHIAEFMLLGGPGSALIAATWGTMTLLATGTIPASNLMYSWWTWYTGDVLGILIFAPLLVLILNRRVLNQRKRAVTIPLLILFTIVIGFFASIREWDNRQQQLEFIKDSMLISSLIEKQFSAYLLEVQSLKSFYDASVSVERDEFKTFTKDAFLRTPGILALSWIARVTDAQRDAFVRDVRHQGISKYNIQEKGPDGRLRIADHRPEYYASDYVEPFKQYERLLGFDVMSEKTRRDAFLMARDRNIPTTSNRIRLLMDEEPDVYGFLIVMPIYHQHMPVDTVEQRRDALQGFISAGFRFRDIISPIMKNWEDKGIRARLINEKPDGREAFYASAGVGMDANASPYIKTAFDTTTPLKIFDKHWSLQLFKLQDYMLAHVNWAIWAALSAGMFMTALCSVFLLYMTGRSVEIEEIVEDRTEQLKRQRQFLELAMNATQDGVWDWDQNKTTLWLSPRWKAMLGYRDDEIPNSLIGAESVIHPQDLITWRDRIAGYMTGRYRDFLGIYRFFHKDGSLRYILSRAIGERNEDGRVVRLVGAHTDVTEIERAKRDLEMAKEEADSANRAKSDFLANMSHEIRTPMNGIIGMTHLLLETELDPQQRHYTQTVGQSAESLLHIINDILDFSKIEAGRLELEHIPFDLQILCEEVSELMFMRSSEKNVEFLLSWALQCPASFLGDPGRIRQILLNLCGNAVKFTEKGHVLLDVHCENVTEESATIKIAVNDTGIGIPEEKLNLIFNKFDQADTSTTRKYGGTGLGLAIARELVTIMGGELGVESIQNSGSSFFFTLTLPRVDESAVPSRVSVQKTFYGHGLRALIVDDNQIACEIMENYLTATGMDVVIENNPLNAMARLDAALADDRSFAFLMLDYAMPELDGIELAAAITKQPRFKGICPVLITSQPGRSDTEMIAKAGIRGYLTKPVRPSELSAVLGVLWKAKLDGVQIPLVTRYTIGGVTAQSSDYDDKAYFENVTVLLAEDNQTNQEIVSAMLAHYGIKTVVTGDGRQALQQLKQRAFDLVFMDCQMPVIDGFEATRMIRQEKGGQSVPIIAMTANAMKGDREKCIEAGMNDYIAKPLKDTELENMLVKWLPASERRQRPVKAVPKSAKDMLPSGIDGQAIEKMRMVTGERFKPILKTFIDNALKLMDDLREARNMADADALMRTAHSLKSSVGQLGAVSLQNVMETIEVRAKLQDLRDLAPVFEKAEAEFTEVIHVFTAMVKD